MITTSLCMIVKNEEAVLERCLSGLLDLMDEIVIVDTGSTDRTREIAAKYTDRVYDFEWTEDFAAARNFAFSRATKEYIYSADADEVLDGENRERLRILKETLLPEIEIVQMYYCNQLKLGGVYNYDREYRPKMFRRERRFVWIDPIHETVRTKPLVFDSEIEIIHAQKEDHSARDLMAFSRICTGGAQLSRRLHGLYARELFLVGGKEDFLRAADFFAHSSEDEERSEGEIMEALCVAARAARLEGDGLKFFKFAMKAAALGSCAEICLELGYFYMEAGDDDEAAVWGYNAAFETESILDIRSSGDRALLFLSQCCLRMGEKERAEEYKGLADRWLAEKGREQKGREQKGREQTAE